MVCLSGGKDSHVMLHVLRKIQRRLPFSIELVAVHLDQKQPGYDGARLVEFLGAQAELRFELLEEDTYSVVVEHTEEGKSYCSMCSRLRRGILYTAAERLGMNKIALGHHRDDSLETFMMNLFFSGKMQAMPAKYRSDDGRFEVIRPLIECAESDIAELAGRLAFPILPCNLCGSQQSQRDAMSKMISDLEAQNPNVRQIMLNALRNVRPTHLLDRDLLAAWSARGPDIRPAREAPKPEARFLAAPKLRVIG